MLEKFLKGRFCRHLRSNFIWKVSSANVRKTWMNSTNRIGILDIYLFYNWCIIQCEVSLANHGFIITNFKVPTVCRITGLNIINTWIVEHVPEGKNGHEQLTDLVMRSMFDFMDSSNTKEFIRVSLFASPSRKEENCTLCI